MNFHSSSSSCTKYSNKLHQPSTSSQPNLDVQETFNVFTLNGEDTSPTTTRFDHSLSLFITNSNNNNELDDEEGYSTPTGEISLVPEESWVYSTPTKTTRLEPVCPGAPKRRTNKDHFSSSTTTTTSQSLPTHEGLPPRRGITKQKKYRKTSPSPFIRRRSFPNIRLEFSDIDVSDEGQNTN